MPLYWTFYPLRSPTAPKIGRPHRARKKIKAARRAARHRRG